MKVVLLNKNNTVYTSNAYLVLGNWNRLEDINTLIDVGADGQLSAKLKMFIPVSGKIRLIRLSSHTIILIIQKILQLSRNNTTQKYMHFRPATLLTNS